MPTDPGHGVVAATGNSLHSPAEQAQRYDDPPGTGMSAPEVVNPTVDALNADSGGTSFGPDSAWRRP